MGFYLCSLVKLATMAAKALVREIHKIAGGPRFSLAITGGGASVIGTPLRVARCSRRECFETVVGTAQAGLALSLAAPIR